jgi:tRNA pseudouridine38-40 synthase
VGQVCDALIASRLQDRELLHALASLLPGDVRPRAVRTVAPDFHSQHDALSKTYRYRLDRTPTGDPFLARYALHHPAALDRAALDDALARLAGRHDWSSFTGAACTVSDRVRTLLEASYAEPTQDSGVFTFTADGFLTHMVRNLVGTLLDVGRGRIPSPRMEEILAARDRRLAGATAPAHGLVLERVRYPGET